MDNPVSSLTIINKKVLVAASNTAVFFFTQGHERAQAAPLFFQALNHIKVTQRAKLKR